MNFPIGLGGRIKVATSEVYDSPARVLKELLFLLKMSGTVNSFGNDIGVGTKVLQTACLSMQLAG